MLYVGRNRLLNVNVLSDEDTKVFEEEIAAIKSDIVTVKEDVASADSKATEKTRTIVFDTFLNFHNFIDQHTTISVNGADFTPSDMKTGDIVRILEDGVSDFWYEADENGEEGGTYEYNEVEYSLTVWGLYQMSVLGRMHETAASASVTEAATSASAAAEEAKKSATDAAESASEAATVATSASTSAQEASASADRAETAAEEAAYYGGMFETDTDSFEPVNIIENGAPEVIESSYWTGASGLVTSDTYSSYKSYADLLDVIHGHTYVIPNFKGVLTFYNEDATAYERIIFSSGTPTDRTFTVPEGKTKMGVSIQSNLNPPTYINRITPTGDEEEALPVGSDRLLVKYRNLDTNIKGLLSTLAGKKIVNFGDSIFGNARPPADVSTMLAELTCANVYNCAFGGCRMSYHESGHWDAFSMYRLAYAIANGDWSVQDDAINYSDRTSYAEEPLAILKELDFSTVDIVTIAYGTNDFFGDMPIDNAENPYDTTAVCGALRYSIEQLLGAFPNLRIFVLLPTWRFWMDDNGGFTEDSSTRTNDIGKTLPDYVSAIAETAKAYNLPVIDNYYELGINKINRAQYFPATDGTHHNEKGRMLIAKHIAHELF